MRYSTLTTPVGELALTADPDGALTRLYLPNRPPDTTGWERDDALLEPRPPPARRSTSPASAREFDLAARARAARRSSSGSGTRCSTIPYGETDSYGEIAARDRAPDRVRAPSAPPTAATRSRSSCPATA